MRSIDLNADVGEGFASVDATLIPLVTSANIACGGHAGDAGTMSASVTLCMTHGVAIGAHPSYPDREGFGRREVAMAPRALRDSLVSQLTTIAAVAARAGARLSHVKPHGALYNRAAVDPELAELIVGAVREVDASLALVGLAGSLLPVAGRAAGLRVLEEGFADRRYDAKGLLLPRGTPGAVIDDPELVLSQLRSMVMDQSVRSACGMVVPVAVDTVCLHGDGRHAVEFARRVRGSLRDAGVHLMAPKG